MAGRGRAATSMTHEQMASLGLMGMKDMSQSITAPPPVFPALMSKPVALETGAGRDFKILWKEDFISFLKDSPYFSHPLSEVDSKIQRYSDKYVQVLTTSKRDKSSKHFVWQQLPAELRPNWKRKQASTTTPNTVGGARGAKKANTSKAINLEEKLKVLEAKELGTAAKESVDPAANAKTTDSDDEDEELAEDEQDEEMDEDNDYGNSYFDNGDAYNEEDDNLDDGPVY